jgi:hypothetical protein
VLKRLKVTAPSAAAKFITQRRKAAKEEDKEIFFFLSFAPLRLCVNHTVTSPEAVTLEPPACRAQLVSGSIYQPKTSVCVARWMLKQVQHDAWEEYRSAISAPLREPFFRRPSAGWGLSRLSVERGAIRRDAIGSSMTLGGMRLCDLRAFAALRLCVIKT